MIMEQRRDESSDQFPVGMKVLAVVDDPICLGLLECLLQKRQYHVTTTSKAITALKILRENKNNFDLIISDVHMPDMDGFKLLEMDLPVIMLSSNDDPKLVMKGITHGACDYLLKPVRFDDIKHIWQHVPSKNFDRDIEKPHVVWTAELHHKFVAAVNKLGIEKVVPKKILMLMNVDKLTRPIVASHLQRYRLYLRRIGSMANMVAALEGPDSPYLVENVMHDISPNMLIPCRL